MLPYVVTIVVLIITSIQKETARTSHRQALENPISVRKDKGILELKILIEREAYSRWFRRGSITASDVSKDAEEPLPQWRLLREFRGCRKKYLHFLSSRQSAVRIPQKAEPFPDTGYTLGSVFLMEKVKMEENVLPSWQEQPLRW